MSEYQKFLKIRYKIWWIIFICAQVSVLILMNHSFAAETWVKSDSNAWIINFQWDDDYNRIYDGGKFVGRLLSCKETCDESYEKLSKEWCDLYDDLDNDNLYYEDSYGDVYYYTDDAVEIYKSVCLLYKSLYIGACINLAFEISAIISIVLWVLGMLLYIKWKMWIWLAFISSGCTWLLHYIAFIGYILVTNANFDGDCVEFPNDGSKPKLCAEQGPTIMLVLAILIPIICILFCIVACNLKSKHGNEGLRKIKAIDISVTSKTVIPEVPFSSHHIEIPKYEGAGTTPANNPYPYNPTHPTHPNIPGYSNYQGYYPNPMYSSNAADPNRPYNQAYPPSVNIKDQPINLVNPPISYIPISSSMYPDLPLNQPIIPSSIKPSHPEDFSVPAVSNEPNNPLPPENSIKEPEN